MAGCSEWNAEKLRLAMVLQTIDERLADARRVADSYAGRAIEERRSLWESEVRNIASYDEWHDVAQVAAQMAQGERSIAFFHAQAKQLERMRKSPYFGRVDFRETGGVEVESIYIGIAGLHHPMQHRILAYDWRAPISSLFYDAEPALARGKKKATLVRLGKSYRSTRQIMEFARALLARPDDVEVMQRDGPKPRVVQVSGDRELVDAIARDVEELQGRGMLSVAVICKTAARSLQLHRRLTKELTQKPGSVAADSSATEIRLLTADTARFQTGAVVLPAYLAKGLEFDAVILADASESVYGSERERGLLYTACTRALHELRLYYTGALSPLIAAIDGSLYEWAGICGGSLEPTDNTVCDCGDDCEPIRD